MNWFGWVDFFKDDQGRKSSVRLTVIIGCLISSGVVAYQAIADTLTEAVFGLYLAYCGGVYGMMKFSDNSVTKASINSTTPPPNVTVQNVEKMDKITETGNVSVGS